MTRTALVASVFLLCALAAGLQAAVGVPVDSFPSWSERMIHVLVNRARSDPAEDLVGCSNCPEAACYTPQSPLAWNEDLAHAARFHAANLTFSGCGMRHDSPCQLENDIGNTYPGNCDGSISCACEGQTASCSGSSNSSTWDRLAAFGVSTSNRAENIASNGDPFAIFYLWLWESSSSSKCEFNLQNGHRYNILNGNYTHIGVGQDGNFTVQDFWHTTAIPQKIPSGAHYPQNGTSIAFRANWNDAQSPRRAQVNIDGILHDMLVERGSEGNATYLLEAELGSGCVQYYFQFTDSSGEVSIYPGAGSFGINCAYDWTNSRLEKTQTPLPAATYPLLMTD